MNIKKNIPNAITLGNLLFGCLALVFAFEDQLVWTAYFVGVSLVLDFFDGFTARLLKVSSAIGKDLDSLADMVTFGVVPGVVAYKLIAQAIILDGMLDPKTLSWGIHADVTAYNAHSYLPYLGFIITIFSCIRLAKFNNDTRQSDSFIGLPTPANTMVICSLPLILHFQYGLFFLCQLIVNPVFLIGFTCLMSYLLIAEIPLFALKFKNFTWKDNKLPFSFLAISVLLIVLLHFAAIPLVILLYILLSLFNNWGTSAKAK